MIAFIILNYLNYWETVECAKSITNALEYRLEYSVIIVDNASPNDSAQVLSDFASIDSRYIFLQSGTNKGYASGNNIGLKEAARIGANYALIINPDIEGVTYEKVKEMIDYALNLNATIVSPSLAEYNDVRSRIKRPSLIYLLFRPVGTLVNLLGKTIPGDFRMFSKKVNAKPVRIYKPYGSCMMINIKKIERVGYLDENTFLFGEEVILAERLLRANDDSIYLLPWISVYHRRSTSVDMVYSSIERQKQKEASNRYYFLEYRRFGVVFSRILLLSLRIDYLLRRSVAFCGRIMKRKKRN